MGEGEVSVRIQHPDEDWQIEGFFCGLWRVRHLHNRTTRLLTDRLEAGSAP
ncbi:hypothetical protein KCP71_17965 [Salmonella enterica subsp. enterica]|nr:hypothetical protein KCP71_17965 [Salmonella enterica subsp. enterica]